MIRAGWVCLLLSALCLIAKADETTKSAAVKKLCQKLCASTIKGDYAYVIDHTLDSVVKQMGGRENAIKTIEAAVKQMQDQEFTLKAFNVGEPGEFLIEGGNTFVLVPTRLEMVFPGGKVIAKSYLLGISADEGKTWKFVDEGGMKHKKEVRDKLLPKLPANLKLPDPIKPEIIKDN